MKHLRRPTGFIMLVIIICITGLCRIHGQESDSDYTSKVPKYTFPTTLEEQEAALESNPLLLRMLDSRKNKSNDPSFPFSAIPLEVSTFQ